MGRKMTEAEKADRYGPVVAVNESSSRPGKFYEVRRNPKTGELTCNCRGWAMRKTCCHVKHQQSA